MTQFPGQHSRGVIGIMLVTSCSVECIGLAHKTNMATTQKSHGGWHVIIIHLCRCQSKGVYINDI